VAQEGKTSFERDIKPLFRQMDIDHMEPFGVFLDDYGYMSKRENAESVRGTLVSKEMPPDGPYWSQEQLDLLSRWIADGCSP